MSEAVTYTANVDGKWYAFGFDEEKNEIFTIGKDCDPVANGTSRWYTKSRSKNVSLICSPSKSQAGAVAKAKRGGKYKGVFKFND